MQSGLVDAVPVNVSSAILPAQAPRLTADKISGRICGVTAYLRDGNCSTGRQNDHSCYRELPGSAPVAFEQVRACTAGGILKTNVPRRASTKNFREMLFMTILLILC